MKSSIEKYNIKEDLNMDLRMIFFIIGIILVIAGFVSNNEIVTILGRNASYNN